MIPLNDENPTELRPWMTVLLIIANAMVWVFVQGAGEMQALEASVVVFGAQPCEITGACQTTGLGASALLTSMFMHGGWGHILATCCSCGCSGTTSKIPWATCASWPST